MTQRRVVAVVALVLFCIAGVTHATSGLVAFRLVLHVQLYVAALVVVLILTVRSRGHHVGSLRVLSVVTVNEVLVAASLPLLVFKIWELAS